MAEEHGVRRRLLHAVMAAGCVNKATVVQLFYDLLRSQGKSIQRNLTLESCLRVINEDLHCVGFGLKMVKSEHDGKAFLCFVNLVSDDLARGLHKDKDWQLTMVNTLLETFIAKSGEDGFLTEAEVSASRPSGSGVKDADWMAHAAVLATEGWLSHVPRRRLYYLGPRALAEFRDVLLERTARCERCREPVVFGDEVEDGVDSDGEAKKRLTHIACKDATAEAWLPELKQSFEALKSSAALSVPLSATAAELSPTLTMPATAGKRSRDAASSGPTQSSSSSAGTSRRRSAVVMVDDDDEEGEDPTAASTSPQDVTQTQKRSQRSQRSGRRSYVSAAAEEGEEDEEEEDDDEPVARRPKRGAKAPAKHARKAVVEDDDDDY